MGYRVARKRHVCTLCGLPIAPLTRYFYQRITPWDHPENETYFDFKAHPRCESVWQSVAHESDGILPEPTDFWDDLNVHCPNICRVQTPWGLRWPGVERQDDQLVCDVCQAVLLTTADLVDAAPDSARSTEAHDD